MRPLGIRRVSNTGKQYFSAGPDGSNLARYDVQDVLDGHRLRTLQKNMFLNRKIAQTVENQRFATDLMPPGGRGAATSGNQVKQLFSSKSMVFPRFQRLSRNWTSVAPP